MSYEEKYLKYKNKYLELKSQILSMQTEEESGVTNFFSNLGLNNLFGGAPKLTEEGEESSPDSERQAQIPADEQDGGARKSRSKVTRSKAKRSGKKHFFDDSDIKKSSESSKSESDFSSSDLDW